MFESFGRKMNENTIRNAKFTISPTRQYQKIAIEQNIMKYASLFCFDFLYTKT